MMALTQVPVPLPHRDHPQPQLRRTCQIRLMCMRLRMKFMALCLARCGMCPWIHLMTLVRSFGLRVAENFLTPPLHPFQNSNWNPARIYVRIRDAAKAGSQQVPYKSHFGIRHSHLLLQQDMRWTLSEVHKTGGEPLRRRSQSWHNWIRVPVGGCSHVMRYKTYLSCHAYMDVSFGRDVASHWSDWIPMWSNNGTWTKYSSNEKEMKSIKRGI